MARPQDQRRARDAPTGGPIGLVVGAVEPQACAVVLEHRAHGLRVVDGLPVLRERGGAHVLGRAPVPGVGIGEDGAFGLVGLGEEEPVPPSGREPVGAPGEGFGDGHAVEHGERGHRVRVVEREAQRDVAAPVVPDHGEALVPEAAHEGEHVRRHRALRVRSVVVGGVRLAGPAVAAQVGADHGVAGLVQEAGDRVPRGGGARVAVEQEDRGPGGRAAPDAEHHGAEVEPLVGETVEHPHSLARPMRSSGGSASVVNGCASDG